MACAKRTDHFTQWLDQLLAVHEDFPQDVMQALREELPEQPTPATVRGALKRLGLHAYFEHVHALGYQLAPTTWKLTLELTPEERARILGMFHTVARDFDNIYVGRGASFPSYQYVLIRLLETIGKHTHGLPPMQDAKKRRWDAMWESLR
jgi:hypothetical protein